MKIGMILDQQFPPDSRVENEASTLIDEGHQVFLFCLSYDGISSEEVVNKMEVRRYASSTLEYKLSALAYTVPFYTNRLSKKITDFISKNKVEVLHVHDMRVAGAVFKANKKFGLPVVLDLHENRPAIMKFYPHLQKFPGKYLISLKKWQRKEEEFIKKSTKVIVVTEQAAEEIVNRVNIDRDKIVVVPNSVRKSFYEQHTEDQTILHQYANKFVVLYVGDTNVRRGLLTAIEASKELSKQIEQYKLVIVGNSTTDPVLKRRVKDLGIEDVVDFEGWKDVSLFPSYIKSSDICISPLHRNLHHDTTYANKIFQYMSFGKALLVSDATAQKDIVETAGAGWVHEEKNVQDFIDKALDIYSNSKQAQAFGNHGREFIETQFSWEITSRDLVRLYENI